MWATFLILPLRASTSLLDQDEYFLPNHPAHHSYGMIFLFIMITLYIHIYKKLLKAIYQPYLKGWYLTTKLQNIYVL